MKKKGLLFNFPLIIGGIIVVFLLIIGLIGPQIVPLDPYAMNFHEIMYENGKMIESKPQMPPNDIYIFGTDVLGRDLFSQIIYGARITLSLGLFVAIGRFLVAVPFAYFAGFGGKISNKIIELFNKAFSALPALIIAFIILRFSIVRRLELDKSIIAFAFVLTLIGWGRLGTILKGRINDILQQDFIQGEIAIGKSKILIALQNVLPHLIPTIIINFFFEIGRTLVLIASLGIFEVYVGAKKVSGEVISSLGLSFTPNYHPEWGGILASSKYAIMVKKPWMALYPALAFFISILGLNLLAEGIKIEVNKRTSKVITYIRRVPYYLSPKTFIYEIKNFKEKKFPVILKSTIVFVFIVAILLGSIVPSSIYELNSNELFGHVEELSQDKYYGRMTGTKGRDKTSEYIIDIFEEYGIEPYFEEGYIKEIKTNLTLAQVNDSKLHIVDSADNKLKSFNYKTDFNIRSIFTSKSINYKPRMSGEILTHDNYLKGKYDRDKTYFLLLDAEKIRQMADYAHRNFFFDLTYRNSNIIGVIYLQENMNSLNTKTSLLRKSEGTFSRFNDPIMLYASKGMVDELENKENVKIVLENDIEAIDNFTVKNIGGIIKGKNSDKKDTIVITTNYDYFGVDGNDQYKGLIYNGTSIAATLEMVKGLGSLDIKPDNDIVFMFFDASEHTWDTGAKMQVKTDFRMFKDTFAFGMNELGVYDSDILYMDTSYASTNEKKYFQYAKYIKKRAKELEIDLKQSQLINGREHIAYIKNAKGRGILLKTLNDPYHKYFGKPQNDLSLIDKEKLTKQAQLILDTIIYIAYSDSK